MEKPTLAQIDDAFMASLYKNLKKGSPAIYQLKKALGRNITDSLPVYMDFLSMSEGNVMPQKEDVYFLISCIYYKFERTDTADDKKRSVRFEELLGRLYGQSGTTSGQIKRLLDTKYGTPPFQAAFMRFLSRCCKELGADERLNYKQLLFDLKTWDNEDRKTKYNWARTINKVYVENLRKAEEAGTEEQSA